MHTRRACRTACGATAIGALLFVLRNSLGTWNVPNLSCRAKTLWSCEFGGDAGVCPESCYAFEMEGCALIHTRRSSTCMCADMGGVSGGIYGQGWGWNRGHAALSRRLLRLFAGRLPCHHELDALLL